MSSALNSGQFLQHKTTRKWGVSALDPYGVCAEGEVAVTYRKADDPDMWLGDGYPLSDFIVVSKENVPSRIRKKFAHLVP